MGDMMMNRLSWLLVFVFCVGAGAQVIQKHWVETYSWQGFGTLATDQFQIFGNEWRIRYKTLNNGPLSVAFHEVATEKTTTVVNRRSGRTLGFEQYKFTPGEKFLFIRGSLGGWRVSVEQYVDSVEEWNCLRYVKQKPALEKRAAWAGESSREISHTSDQAWKLEFEHISDGLVQIQVFDATGTMHFDSMTSKGGSKGGGWMYAPGTYSIKITTSDVPWCIYALTIAETAKETADK
jgi:hypothetical protein